MKLFECQNCRQPLYFENTKCESCGLTLGYLPERGAMTALRTDKSDPQVWRALAVPGQRYRFCANAQHGVCNWLVDIDSAETFCAACRHNRVIPDLSIDENLRHWRMIEIAKHRLFYTLIKLRLPRTTPTEDPSGLVFDFLADPPADRPDAPRVMTGHADGVITINLAEADDPERERRRRDMSEHYRTLLGHFRHESAHYYWSHLIANTPALDEFRTLFGDERQDYQAALQNYYAQGAPTDWPEHFVTAYATSHPWEDFAETWAHYLHMVDTVETGYAFGLSVRPRTSKALGATLDFDPHEAELERIIDAWLPLTFAVNSLNRSMGQPDLYPFVLAPPVISKLAFVHNRIHAERGKKPRPDGGIRAIIAGLRRRTGSPALT